MNKAYTYAISAVLLVSTLMPLSASAMYYPYNAHLYIPGVDSQSAQVGYNGTVPTPKPVVLNFDIFSGNTATSSGTSTTSSSSGTTSLFGGFFGGSSAKNPTDANGNAISLVSADNTTIYAIINGQKHLIPTLDVLNLYNYKAEFVRAISQADLNKYPRASLVKVKGDTKHIYYLTEGGMVRLMPSDKVLDSYGMRKEDAITISRQEFNYYPQNQYIFLENPLNRDVFQIVGGTGKRYLTPMAVSRLDISLDQVAPVNQTEMDTYKILAPVVQ